MTDPKTGIHEPTVVIPWWLDCRVQHKLVGDGITDDTEALQALLDVDIRHEKGCVRRYGAVADKWVPHNLCPCHTMRSE